VSLTGEWLRFAVKTCVLLPRRIVLFDAENDANGLDLRALFDAV
jgi:hypothetical protein